ncbi:MULTISPECIES: DUF6907 domain-containing protein [Streptomyces]|uniref:Uncharacterized protein n=2 Tax=Streptomyces TaxID=1883 RepID=A0A2U9P0V7_STRAS|nr:hypothetical protein [Streptomyces actuosus]AWT42828.1 hypothetical protein DMT42_11165 [Streptomyces actuosus]MBM4820059.1 hypothetical protein [Streptomyces actuosus]MBM4825059.1 hypothetical protein [Streptomyces actuosus]
MSTADLPVYGPTEPFGDEDNTPAVIVRVAYLLSRAQLETAFGISFAEVDPDRDPESLTPAEVRSEVEGFLAAQGTLAIAEQQERDRLRGLTREQQAVMRRLAAAVERAYPPGRPAVEPPAVQAPVYGPGTVTLQTLDCGQITIPEPSWCLGHGGELVGYRADVTHSGRPVAAEAGSVEFLVARMSWAPLAERQPEPLPVVDVEGFPSMDSAQLRELAAEAALHAGRLYRLSNELDRARRAEA